MLRDTHRAYQELAGADRRLAEVTVRLFQEADEQVATKQDLETLRSDLTGPDKRVARRDGRPAQ